MELNIFYFHIKIMRTYPIREIILRARYGRRAIYPFLSETSRFSIYGAQFVKRYYDPLEDIIILPPQFTPLRLKKASELISREPTFHDVDTKGKIGGFSVSFPLVQASMGSQEDWNKVSCFSARACAEFGIIYGIGENVSLTWGYDKRVSSSQPCFLNRVLTYLENCKELGGLVIQQNEEEAHGELWNRVYSDKRLDQYIQDGKIAFEIKGGQGAKPGLGGEKIVDRETAKKLKQRGYLIYPDPDLIKAKYYERHSSPDIFTKEILRNRIRLLKNNYPRIKIWLKTSGYRDLENVIKVALKEKVDCIVIDGKEGGTGMAPIASLKYLGLPVIACLKIIRKFYKEDISLVISGGLYDGSHIVKCLALGAAGIAMGRPFLIACYAYKFAEYFLEKELYKSKVIGKIGRVMFKPNEKSIEFVKNFLESLKIETQLLTSALGKYNLKDLGKEDLGSLKREVSEALGINYILA